MVMNEKKFIKTESVLPLIEALAEKKQVLVPVSEGPSVVFRPYNKNLSPCFCGLPAISAKESTFPRHETLMTFKNVHDPNDPEKNTVTLTEKLPGEKQIVFGDRPCGARGKLMFDRVYVTEDVKDPYYLQRRENTVTVTIACDRPETTCFCHSVGGGPADAGGSDVLLIPVSGGYVAEAHSETGEALLAMAAFESAGEAREVEADETVKGAMEILGDPDDYASAREKIISLFDDDEFWEEMSSKCLSCGACTYLCPTCYCFNITDDTAGDVGKRVRSWDSCMQAHFTLEASGHNPRFAKANRLKNRVGHKFSYYPELHGGVIACCGCGRCIKSCPAAVDIRRIVKSAQETEDANS
jgi:ferredoxin